MKILAVETSCDDTAVAIVENGRKILASRVASQEKLHAQFGGVVPEVASREHIKAIYPLISSVLSEANLRPKDIDLLAVTTGPGLLGSLMVGVNAVRTLSYLWKKKVISVDHLQGHFYSGFLTDAKIEFPVLALIVSGGHTELVLARRQGEYKYLGGTVDDAAGEAFDKAARLLGLGYPGGPAIAIEAAKLKIKNEKLKKAELSLPRPMINEPGLDMSFSGLKTALSRIPKGISKAAAAAEFQQAVVDVLVNRVAGAVTTYKPKTVILGGGVAANQALRAGLTEGLSSTGVNFVVAPAKYCTDNAAMIGAAAYFTYDKAKKYEWYNAKVKI